MLKIMLQKLWAKRWMSACLLTGILLLVATAVSFPMYRSMAFDRMLQEEFREYLSSQGEWPARNSMVMISKKEAGGKSMRRVEELMEGIFGMLGVSGKENIYYYSLAKEEARSLMHRDDLGALSLRVGFLSNLPEHASILAGSMYSEEGISEDGCLEAVVSQSCMVDAKLLTGETIEFPRLINPDGEPVRLKIVGIFQEKDEKDFYWQKKPEEMISDCLISEAVFREYFTGERAGAFHMTCTYHSLFEYEDLKAEQVEELTAATDWFMEESPYRNILSDPDYRGILEAYSAKKMRIEATLFLLQVPVLILLSAFLFMISGQMYDMERNEISVMKSRGASGGQILRLYLYQSCLLNLCGLGGGLLLGMVFAGALGSARSFLEFDFRAAVLPSKEEMFTWEVFGYAAVAMGISVLVMTFPAVKHSRVTIVGLKRQKAMKKRSWWEVCFLDLICLGVAFYGYYSYTRQSGAVEESVLKGEVMEPLQYMSSSLLIAGLALLAIRLRPLLMQVIFMAGKRFWKPASYVFFLENGRNGRKQQFIMLFLMMAVALGMFHATAARTILQNALENRAYLDGADYIVREVWERGASFGGLEEGEDTPRYYEPDYGKYSRLDNISSRTKVIYDTGAYVELSGNSRQDIVLMGIHTRQFGENTWMPTGLTEKPYYEYLNELALCPDGVLASADFRDILGYQAGDMITYSGEGTDRIKGKIVDFFNYWPGYVPSVLELNPDGSVSRVYHSMLVAPIGTLTSKWGIVPYEVWMTAEEAGDEDEFYRWMREENVRPVRCVDRRADLSAVVKDPLLQGTNGILTMGFLVILLLCGVGYLIYWILSIRSREMLFGILRANGMHRREVLHILINEQMFCGGYSVAAGVWIGKCACAMFVPILQNAYMVSDQILPLRLITDERDMIRLCGAVGAVLVLCLLVLLLLVWKMNVTKALKLGEE